MNVDGSDQNIFGCVTVLQKKYHKSDGKKIMQMFYFLRVIDTELSKELKQNIFNQKKIKCQL